VSSGRDRRALVTVSERPRVRPPPPPPPPRTRPERLLPPPPLPPVRRHGTLFLFLSLLVEKYECVLFYFCQNELKMFEMT
jgi:hypothetical protein